METAREKYYNAIMGYSETMFEMPGDYGIDSEEMPSVDCGIAHMPAHVRPAMFSLHAKETVLGVLSKHPEKWSNTIAKLTMEAGSLRNGISYEYLNRYDHARRG